jgi:8-oxo-dGTP pyrophosphatase MutT (NUDIX family)
MHQIALIGLVDQRGWLLMQERDENAPVDPEKWGLLGGGVEPLEAPFDAAVRELAEESGLTNHDLQLLGTHVLPCAIDGEQDHVSLFGAQTSATDADIRCGEGRQIVFVAPHAIPDLDLSHLARTLYRAVLAIRDAPS